MINDKKKRVESIKSLIIAKKFCSALIFLSLAVIFISSLIYLYSLFVFTLPMLRCRCPFGYEDLLSTYANIRFLLLRFILSGFIFTIIIIPIMILLSKRLNILVFAQQINPDQIRRTKDREEFKLEINQDFLFQTYKGL